MTGADALNYILRRLALEGLRDPETDDPELYELLTDGRDQVAMELGLAAPGLIKLEVALDVQVDDRLYNFPAGVGAIRVLELRSTDTKVPLTPMASHDDLGEYEWVQQDSQIRLATGVEIPGGVTMVYVPNASPIDEDTADTTAAWGIPQIAHRTAAMYAVWQALITNEESDGRNAATTFAQSLERLGRTMSEYDANQGLAGRQAFLSAFGQQHADVIY